jgi:hypothetical protein
MSTINTNYNAYTNLAYILNQSATQNSSTTTGDSLLADLSGSNTGTTSSSTAPSLVTLLDGNSADSNSGDNSLLTLLEQSSNMRTYNLPTDANGNTVIPTVAEMNSASTPESQLTLANYVAQSVLMQSDASSKTDNASRISDIASQAQSVLQALATATTSLTNNGTTSLSAADQKTVSTTLNAINTALSQVVNLLPKADSATQTSVKSQLANLDTLAFNVAGLSGTAWTSVTGNSSNTISGYSAAASTGTASVYGSTGLLNITV